MIDNRAIIDPSARIAEGVKIGPWSIIGPNVEIGEGTTIGPHVIISRDTKIGRNNQIFQFAAIGGDPQDKKYAGEPTYLEMGNDNIVREYCTINRGTAKGGGLTKIGNDNMFMAYTHIAHDCIVGSHITFANYAATAGHVTIDDYAIFSGFAGAHQFCHIGAHSFLGKGTLVGKDVLPYVIVDGFEAKACGLNSRGLKARGFSTETIGNLRKAYKIIYRNSLIVTQAIEQLNSLVSDCPEVKLMIEMLQKSERGIVR